MAPPKVSVANPAIDATANDQLAADALPGFVLVRTDQVDQGDRLRDIDPVWAHALGQVMLREGQRTPTEICRLPGSTRWTLVSGGHRLAGAIDAEIVYLRAEIVSADRTDRKMREVSENLWRRDLEPIDRAAFIAQLVSLRRAKAGLEEVASRDAKVPLSLKKQVDLEAGEMLETISSTYGFTEEIGDELGFSGRTIRNDLMLYRGLAPSLVEKLRAQRHPVLRNASQLRTLAKLQSEEQKRVVWALTNSSASVAEALAIARGETKRPADPEAKRLSAFIGAFQRMSLAEKKGALAHLAGMLPAGTSIGAGKPSFSPEHERYRDEAATALDEAILFLDGMEEDEVLDGDRAEDARRVRGQLHLTRFTINANGFELSAGGDA